MTDQNTQNAEAVQPIHSVEMQIMMLVDKVNRLIGLPEWHDKVSDITAQALSLAATFEQISLFVTNALAYDEVLVSKHIIENYGPNEVIYLPMTGHLINADDLLKAALEKMEEHNPDIAPNLAHSFLQMVHSVDIEYIADWAIETGRTYVLIAILTKTPVFAVWDDGEAPLINDMLQVIFSENKWRHIAELICVLPGIRHRYEEAFKITERMSSVVEEEKPEMEEFVIDVLAKSPNDAAFHMFVMANLNNPFVTETFNVRAMATFEDVFSRDFTAEELNAALSPDNGELSWDTRDTLAVHRHANNEEYREQIAMILRDHTTEVPNDIFHMQFEGVLDGIERKFCVNDLFVGAVTALWDMLEVPKYIQEAADHGNIWAARDEWAAINLDGHAEFMKEMAAIVEMHTAVEGSDDFPFVFDGPFDGDHRQFYVDKDFSSTVISVWDKYGVPKDPRSVCEDPGCTAH